MSYIDPALAAPRPRTTGRTPIRVAIVGAGFSGTLLAINLLEQPGTEVLLIERERGHMGAGVAYSTADSSQYLNVRANNMSAFADRPDDFCHWLERQVLGGDSSFATRATYGRYLRERLAQAIEAHGSRLKLIDDAVLDIEERHGRVTLGLANGGLIEADRAVLAIGNLPPHDPPGVDRTRLPSWRYVSDPWATPFEGGLDGSDPVLVIGSGLTAIDAILRLAASSFDGPIVALSRRGLRPLTHEADLPRPAPVLTNPAERLSDLVGWARAKARTKDWRLVIDSIRPVTQALWSSADGDTRARFLRHLRPFWDIHRHRLAPNVAARIDALVGSGRLSFHAGRIASVTVEEDALGVEWRPRGADKTRTLRAARVINCTGPQGDLLRSTDPLIRRLLAQGRIRPDALRLGLDVDRSGHIIDAAGRTSAAILAIGPMTRGDLWESVAVPDIRAQVETLAERLAGAEVRATI